MLVALHSFQEPGLVNGIFNSIQVITDEARRALSDPEMPRESLLRELSVRPLTPTYHKEAAYSSAQSCV